MPSTTNSLENTPTPTPETQTPVTPESAPVQDSTPAPAAPDAPAPKKSVKDKVVGEIKKLEGAIVDEYHRIEEKLTELVEGEEHSDFPSNDTLVKRRDGVSIG